MAASIGPLPLGDEGCAPGRCEVLGVETGALPPPEALAVPGAEHAARDGPRRTVHTEGGLAGERGRGHAGGRSGKRGQQLNSIGVTERTENQLSKTRDLRLCRAFSAFPHGCGTSNSTECLQVPVFCACVQPSSCCACVIAAALLLLQLPCVAFFFFFFFKLQLCEYTF